MQIQLFATKSDLLSGLEWIESQKELHWARCLEKSDEILIYDSIKDIEELGINKDGKVTSGIQFLVVEKQYKIQVEEVQLHKGGLSHHIGQMSNPHSIIFQTPGIYGDKFLIMGTIGTISKSRESIKLYKFFKKGFTRGFKKIKGLYISPEALKLANSGYRLITMHIGQSTEYDLKID